jgi:hypothetical protein
MASMIREHFAGVAKTSLNQRVRGREKEMMVIF